MAKKLPPRPGTREFGERASERKQAMLERERRGDLRVQTAYKRAKERKERINRALRGD